MMIDTLMVVGLLFGVTVAVTAVAAYRESPPPRPEVDEAAGEVALDELETGLLLRRQHTVLTDGRLVQGQKQLPLPWLGFFPLWWLSWQDQATFVDLRELDSATFRRGYVALYLGLALALTLVAIDLGLMALVLVLALRVVQVELRSRGSRIVIQAFAVRARELVDFLVAVRRAARIRLGSYGSSAGPAVDALGALEDRTLRLERADVFALFLVILAPGFERQLLGRVSVDGMLSAAVLLGVPILFGARRGMSAGVVAGLFAAGGLLGAIHPSVLTVPVDFPGSQWLAAVVGLPLTGGLAGLAARATTPRGATVVEVAVLGALGAVFVYLPQLQILAGPIGWSRLLVGAGAALVATALLAYFTQSRIQDRPPVPPTDDLAAQ